jgi:hypothetical protein
MDELVEKLSNGKHLVEVVIRPKVDSETFRQCIDDRYVHLRFLDTNGGTEVGIPIDSVSEGDAQQLAQSGEPTLKIEGEFSLNFTPVRCVATIDTGSFRGFAEVRVRSS